MNKIEMRVLNEKIKSNMKYATDGSAAIDLVACLDDDDTGNSLRPNGNCIRPGNSFKCKTGLSIHIADIGMAAIILPRSGMGSKGIVLANTIGLIDSDYQGEIIVTLKNTNRIDSFIVNDGDRIAQMIFVPILHPILVEVEEFSTKTNRGDGGFGSTGR